MSRPLSCMDEEPSEMELLCYHAMTITRARTDGPERALAPGISLEYVSDEDEDEDFTGN